MDRCLLPAKGSACVSLLFRHRTDDFGWFELRNPQLEAAGDCRICSSICPFLLHLVRGRWAEILADRTAARVMGGSEEEEAQEQDGSFLLESRCCRGFCRAHHISLEHWTSESSSCFASGLQMRPLGPKCRPGKTDLRRYLDSPITWKAHWLLDVVTESWAVGKFNWSQQHLLVSPPGQGAPRISSVAGDTRQNRRSQEAP